MTVDLNAAKLDFEDRREIWRLLKRLGPMGRLRFLRWCCKQCNGPDGIAEVRVTSSTGTAQETYYDIMMLCFGHGLDLGRVAEQLVQVVRRM